VLRYIRVESKQELKDRIMAAMDEFNRHPVVHTSSDKLDQAARYDWNLKIDVLGLFLDLHRHSNQFSDVAGSDALH
jgi:hypothetical protein